MTTKSKTGFNAELDVSPELQGIVGVEKISRPDMTKKVWEYIKAHELQDAKDKRIIKPDDKLAKVLGEAPINMMKMTGLLSKHLSNPK
ncbi:MAG: hypothetical protein HQK51_15640 [Oligoflexia bacterium]|nr:hypothetical protein [Oligoflexia bacterium]